MTKQSEGQVADHDQATRRRKVIVLMHVSLDGFVAGPHGELEWAQVDEEIYRAAAAAYATVDTALYGRVTYGMMAWYWPTVPANPESTPEERRHARWVDNVTKIVFSRTLKDVTWNNTRLIAGDVAGEVARQKAEPGGDMMTFGSPSIVHELARHGLIDEYQLTINPVLLGSGTPLFESGSSPVKLELMNAKAFDSGVVGLRYRTCAAGDR